MDMGVVCGLYVLFQKSWDKVEDVNETEQNDLQALFI